MALSLKDAPELQPYILKNVQKTGKILGRGSFGTVEEMHFDHALCAGKKIHQILVDPSSIGAARLVEKFQQECKLLKELRYPHIVQFMGLCFFEDSNVPVIVMELLNNNIDSWLSSAKKELPLSLKTSILRDTAKGLNYLHSHDPVIIHRDLTARNVLLTSSMTAKIADLGNAYIVPPQHLVKTMTRVPGTIPYMPPEAFQLAGKYTFKLDMFSFGHLALYIIIQEEVFTHLLGPTYPDPSNPGKVIGRSEVERRSYYFEKLSSQFASSHDIPTVIKDCLSDLPDSRPTADSVIKVLEEMQRGHVDEYGKLSGLNRFDIAEKLRFGAEDFKIQERILNKEMFLLEFVKNKRGKNLKEWRKHLFCFEDQVFKGYGDPNKAPVHKVEVEKIESVMKRPDDPAMFEVKMKDKVWILKSSSEAEATAWVNVLQSKSAREEVVYDVAAYGVPTSTPPPPPVPPPQEDDLHNAYEPIHQFTRKPSQSKKESYMPLDTQSLNPAPFYDQPTVERSEVKRRSKKQRDTEAKSRPHPPLVPQISIEEDKGDNQAEVPTYDVPAPRPPSANEEQLEILAKMLEMLMPHKDVSKEEVESLYSIFQRDAQPQCSGSDEAWPKSDQGGYVDIDAIEVTLDTPSDTYDTIYDDADPSVSASTYDTIPGDDLYDTIPDTIESGQKQKYYYNLHEKPPIPPKKSPRHSVKKPSPAPRGFQRSENRLSVKKTSSSRSLDDVISASSLVSTDMLVLGSSQHDDVNNEDEYEAVEHRPEWAKAKMTVSNDLWEKFGPDDEMLDLLTLNRKSIRNRVEFASGQFGKVYRATFSTSDGEDVPVAVKTVKYDTDEDKAAFIKEMKVMSRMLHPNIVRLFGLVLEENWIVLEYLSHGDLGSFLAKNRRPVGRLIKYMTHIAMGMHHISSLGLIHRDLAARNILVSQNEVCKVADFGLIRSCDRGMYLCTGKSKIPIRWSAPEVIRENVYYPASDVWSYGIVLWEMANPTKIPYQDVQDYAVGQQVADGEPTRHHKIPSIYPDTLKRIMLACWQFRPDKRPSFQYITALLTKERYSSVK